MRVMELLRRKAKRGRPLICVAARRVCGNARQPYLSARRRRGADDARLPVADLRY